MVYPISDVNVFDSFCTDSSADNFYRFADGALPVFLETDGTGEPVVRTNPERKEAPFGYLYILYEPDAGKRTVVVRC
jgi:hypothetical protein